MPKIPRDITDRLLDVSGNWARHIADDMTEFSPHNLDIGQEAVDMANDRGLSRQLLGLSGALALIKVGYKMNPSELRAAGASRDHELLSNEMSTLGEASDEVPKFFGFIANRDRN